MKILYRYIFRQMLAPYFFAVFVITGIMLANEVIVLTDLILKRGVPSAMILQLAILSLSHIIALSVPMAVLLSTIMTYGRLTDDNELMAMKAGGISLYVLLIPALVFGLFNVALMFWFHNSVLPNSNYKLKNMMYSVRNTRPTLVLEDGMFNKLGDELSIYIRELDHENNLMYDLMIYDYHGVKIPTLIKAEKGHLLYLKQTNQLMIELEDGEIHQVDEKKNNQYSKVQFKEYTYRLSLPTNDLDSIDLGRGQREMNIVMMQDQIIKLEERREQSRQRIRDQLLLDCQNLVNGKGSNPRRTFQYMKNEINVIQSLLLEIHQYEVEVHKKLAIPFACLVFILIGVPLGVRAKRGGVGPAITISVIFFIFYYGCLMIGEELGDNGTVPAWVTMWFANVIITVYSIFLLYRTVQETTYIHWDKFRFWQKWAFFKPKLNQ